MSSRAGRESKLCNRRIERGRGAHTWLVRRHALVWCFPGRTASFDDKVALFLALRVAREGVCGEVGAESQQRVHFTRKRKSARALGQGRGGSYKLNPDVCENALKVSGAAESIGQGIFAEVRLCGTRRPEKPRDARVAWRKEVTSASVRTREGL